MPNQRAASTLTRSSLLGGRNRIARTKSGSKAATARPTATATHEDRAPPHQPCHETVLNSMSALWPWFALGGLGAFHGLNPAMGWLFAVALGLHRRSRAAVLLAIPPIAVGHALSIAIVAGTFVMAGTLVNERAVRASAGLLLIGWAVYHQLFGHRHRVRVGMQTGQAGLVLWSFLMATAHGAGLMILPAMIPLCFAVSPAGELTASGSGIMALAAVAVHMAAMLAIMGPVAVFVYEWVGLSILRTAWINLDLVWTGALVAAGLLLFVLA